MRPLGKTEEINVGGITWVNVEAPSPREIQVLGERFNFGQLELEDCLSKRQLQKIEHHGEHLFAIIHCPYLPGVSRIVASSQVSIFLGDDYLVTVHQGNLRPIEEIFQSCRNKELYPKAGPGDILYRVLDSLVDNVFPLLEGVMKELEDIEDEVFNEKIAVVRELTTLRRNIAALRRTVLPLRRIMAGLYDEMQMRSPELAPHFRDVNDHIEKAYAILDEARETVDIYKDTDFTVSTELSNKILAILTIIFTLSIPGTMIGTFYGMNIPLPGGIQTGAWMFLGPYTTLIIILLVAILPTMIMLWYFHRLGWL